MNQVFKDAFNQITVSSEAEEAMLKLYQSKQRNPRMTYNKRPFIQRKLSYILAAIVLIFVPAITVFAATDFFQDTFVRLFGTQAEVIRDNYTVPEVKVLENDFTDLTIDVKGITGDEHTVYIIMDVTMTDGSILNAEEYSFSGGIDAAKHYDYVSSIIPEINMNSISNDWITIPDDNSNDNKITVAYIANVSAAINDEIQSVACDTYNLNLYTLYDGDYGNLDSNVISSGTWKAELSFDYNPASSLSQEVNKVAEFTGMATLDQNIYSLTVNQISLSPLSLRINTNRDEISTVWLNATINMYIEMYDGTIVGYKDREEMYQKQDHYIMSGTNNDLYWILPTSIKVSEVKAVHIGNLEIPISHE